MYHESNDVRQMIVSEFIMCQRAYMLEVVVVGVYIAHKNVVMTEDYSSFDNN